MAKKCPVELIPKVLERAKQKLDDRVNKGEITQEQADKALQAMEEKLRDPTAYDNKARDVRGIELPLDEKEASELSGLKERVQAGFKRGQTSVNAILKDDAVRFFELLNRDRRAAGKKKRESPPPARTDLEQKIDALIEQFENTGNTEKANKLREFRRKLRDHSKANSRLNQDHVDIRALREQQNQLADSLNVIEMLLQENVTKGFDAEIKDLQQQIIDSQTEARKYRERLTKLNEKIADEKDKGKLKDLKREARNVRRSLDKENNNIKGLKERLRSRFIERDRRIASTELGKTRQKIQLQIQDLSAKLSKFGINTGLMLNTLSTDLPATARQVELAIEKARESLEFKEAAVKALLEQGEVKATDLGRLLGQKFVLERADGKKVLSKEEVNDMFQEFKATVYNYAGAADAFILDTEFADEESLAELERLQAAEQSDSGLIDDHNPDAPIVPSKTGAQVEGESNPGTVPEKNKLKKGAELYSALRRLLFKVETLRRMEAYGKFAPLDLMYTALRDIAEIDDINPAILFDDAIEYQADDSMASTAANPEELRTVVKSALKELGLSDSVLNGQEFTNPTQWMQSSRSISFDIETHTDGSSDVFGFVIMETGQKLDPDAVRLKDDNSAYTPDELMVILNELEEYQNAGYKVATYNGNNFDLLLLAEKIGTEEAYNAAARIVLRSVDLQQNITSYGAKIQSDVTMQNKQFKLAMVAESLGVDTVKEHEGYMASLWNKRSRGQELTMKDLSEIRQLDEAAKKELISELNEMSEAKAKQELFNYLQKDGSITLDVLEKMQQKEGQKARITHKDKICYDVIIGELKPTWALDIMRSDHYRGTLEGMRDWQTTETGQQILTTLDTVVGKTEGRGVVFNLDKVQAKLLSSMAIALNVDPDTKAFGKAIMEAADRTLTPEEKATLVALDIVKANAEGARVINEQAFQDAGENLPLYIAGTDETGGRVPQTIFATDTTPEAQREAYIDNVIVGMKKQLDEGRVDLNEMAEKIGYEAKPATKSLENYLLDMAVFAIEKYTSNKKVDLVDFGNAKIDFSPAQSVGRGLIQLMNQDVQGFKKRLNMDASLHDGSAELMAEGVAKGADSARATNLSKIFRLPMLSEVNHVFPRSLAQIESAYADFRVRQRIAHILNPDNITTIEEAKSIIKLYQDAEENPDEVIANTSTALLDILPNVNNRRLFNTIPDLARHREMALEQMLDLPELMVMWQHDAMTWRKGMKLFAGENVKNRMFREDALSPGSLTATAVLAGLGPQVAHVKTFPRLGEDILFRSLERGAEQLAKLGPEKFFSQSNYFDFDMNGAHHLAVLYLMYADPDGESRIDSILEAEELISEAEDRYSKAVDLMIENLPTIIKHYEAEGFAGVESLKQAQNLQKFLAEADDQARTLFKNGMIARMYMGGLKGVRDNIQKFMVEDGRDFGFTADFVAEHAMNAKSIIQMNILDNALGNITQAKRKRLAAALEAEFSKVYDTTNWHIKMRDMAAKAGFGEAGRRMFGFDNIMEAIEIRLDMIAQITGKDVNVIRKRYQDRIDKAQEFVQSLPGQKIRTDEQMRQLYVILMENENAYKTMPTLAAINALQRTPYKLRKDMLEQHADILGVHLEESDLMGFENFNIFFPVGQDASGMRLYMLHHRHQPQNSSLSNVVRDGTPDGNDNNPYAMWDFGKNNLAGKSKEQVEATIEILIAKQIALQLARNYAPKFGNYNAESENRTNFMTEWQRRSVEEDSQYQRALAQESALNDTDRALRTKNGSLVAHSGRFLLRPELNLDAAREGRYNPGAGSNLKGIGAFRPEYGAMPWQERGIFGLMEMEYNLKAEQIRNQRLEIPETDISDVNAILPANSRGHANPYQNSEAPYIHETPFDSTHDMVYGDSSRRLELRANELRSNLEKFAVKNGLKDLISNGEWARIYTIYKTQKAVTDPYLQRMARLSSAVESDGYSMENYREGLRARLAMLQDLTGLWDFHDDVAHETKSYLEFGRNIGIDGKEISSKRFADLLFYLAKNGVDILRPIRVGLSPTNNILLEGDPAADQRTARTPTLTVQGVDSLQVIYNMIYYEDGPAIGTKHLKETLSAEEFAALEKDDNGFVLLSSVPADQQAIVLRKILDSERFDTSQEMELYLFVDEATGAATMGTKRDYQDFVASRQDTTPGKRPKPRGEGGMPRFDTSLTEANAVYQLTPEDLTNIFQQLQNQMLLNKAELAAMLGSEVGVASNPNIEFLNAERRKFYEMQRLAYADEMDMLAYLHSQAGSNLRTTSNINMTNDFGAPLTVYDAAYYIRGGETGQSALSLAYQGYFNQAERMADMYGLKEEAKLLRELREQSKSDSNILPMVLILAQELNVDRGSRIARLQSYFGLHLSKKSIEGMEPLAYSYAQAYLNSINRSDIRNEYYTAAKAWVEKHGRADGAFLTEKAMRFVGIDESSTKEQRADARLALNRASDVAMSNENYFAMTGFSDGRRFGEQFMVNDTDIVETFSDGRGAHLVTSINDMVESGAITEETADFYKTMLASIMDRNQSFEDNLSIQFDSEMNRPGKTIKYSDRIVIKLNPDLLKKRAVPEAIEVFAHEISHVARLKYMHVGSKAYRGMKASFQTRAGQMALREGVALMFEGDAAEVRQLQDAYAADVEEFIAEYGAFMLIANTLKQAKYKKQLRKYANFYSELYGNITEESAKKLDMLDIQWTRAFVRMKHAANQIAQRMSYYRTANPEAFKLLDAGIEVMFNFESRYATDRIPVADTSSRQFNYPLREHNKGSAISDLTEFAELDAMFKRIDKLELLDKTRGLTVDEKSELDNLAAAVERYDSGDQSTTILGLNTKIHVATLASLVTAEGGMARPKNDSERLALATFILEQALVKRGRRGGEAASARSLLAKLADDLRDSGAYSFAVKSLLTGSAYNQKGGLRGDPIRGLAGGSSASNTYASNNEILAALAFLLDSTKGGGQNIFGGSIGGIVQNYNLVQQQTRTVVRASQLIRDKYNAKHSVLVERAAFEYLRQGRPDKDTLQAFMGKELTDEMYADAVNYAKVFAGTSRQFFDFGQQYNVIPANVRQKNTRLGFGIAPELFSDATVSPEAYNSFRAGLSKVYNHKLNNMIDSGRVDHITLYTSGALPRLAAEGNNQQAIDLVDDFYSNTVSDLTDDQRAILTHLEERTAQKMGITLEQVRFRLKYGKGKRGTTTPQNDVAIVMQNELREMLHKAKYEGGYLPITKTNEHKEAMKRAFKAHIALDRVSNIYTGDVINGIETTDNIFGQVPRSPRSDAATNVSVGYLHADLFLGSHQSGMAFEYSTPGDAPTHYLSHADIAESTAYLEGSQFAALDLYISKDIRTMIAGMERGTARKAFGRKAIQDASGVSDMTFTDLINILSSARSDLQPVLEAIQRKHDLAVGAAMVMDENKDHVAMNRLAKGAAAATAVLWGPNQNIASMVNEMVISSVITTLYGGNPLALLKDLGAGFAKLQVGLYSRKARHWSHRRGMFAEIEDAFFDLDSAHRTALDVNRIDYDDAAEGQSMGFGRRWYKAIQLGQRNGTTALRTAMKRRGQKQLIKRLHLLEKYVDAIENYKGKRNRKMYKDVVAEVGREGNFVARLAGAEAVLVQRMYESGVLTRQNVKAIKYMVTKHGLGRDGTINLTRIKEEILMSNRGLNQEISGTGKRDSFGNIYDSITNADLYDALSAIGQFQTRFANESTVESHVLDKPTEDTATGFLKNLYRSFPKLFLTQNVLEQYGRTSPQLFVARLLTSATMDMIYNLLLMYFAGFLTNEDIERWKAGDIRSKDYQVFFSALLRNPIFSARLLPAFASQAALATGFGFFGDETTNKSNNQMWSTMMRAVTPPSVAAVIGTGKKGFDAAADTVRYMIDGDQPTEKTAEGAVDVAAGVIPGMGRVTVEVLKQVIGIERERTSGYNGRRRSRPEDNPNIAGGVSPVSADWMQQDIETPVNDRSILRDVIGESFPSALQPDLLPEWDMYAPRPELFPSENTAPPKVSTQGSDQGSTPNIGFRAPQTPAPAPEAPTEGSRATNPEKPPEGF